MYTHYDPYVLCHYGVKGMKWGVRKSDRYDRRENRYMKKYTRKTAKEEESLNKLLAARAKHRNKINAKYDKKKDRLTRNINPELNKDVLKTIEYQKKAKLKDFDVGTKAIIKGSRNAARDRTDIFKQKAIAVGNKGYKKSNQYRDAYKRYLDVKTSDILSYGSKTYTNMVYANGYINGRPYYTRKRG